MREIVTSIDSPFGSMGKTTALEDWRDVEGVSIPFRWLGSLASESLGSWALQYETIETHLTPDDTVFTIEP